MKRKPVELWKDGIYVRWFPTVTAAATAIGTNQSVISNAIREGHRVYGYDIIYSDKPDTNNERGKYKDSKPVEISRNGKQVRVFASMSDCSRWLGTNRSATSKALKRGGRVGGYDIRVVEEIDYTLWKIKESNKHYEFTRP